MPDVEENKQDLVDIDTSGPGAEVELEETKEKVEIENETVAEDSKPEEKDDKSNTEDFLHFFIDLNTNNLVLISKTLLLTPLSSILF